MQEARLKQWHNYWTPEKKAWLRETIRTEAARYHFREHAFEPFFQWLDRPFQPLDYQNEITTQLLNEWQTSADSLTMLITQVRMNEADKEAVYPLFQQKRRWLSLTVVISPTNGYLLSIRILSDSLYLFFPDFLCPMDFLRAHRTDPDEFPADAGQLDYHCGINGHTGY